MTDPQDPARAARLDELVFAYLEKVESEPGRAAQVLAELCDGDPELAAELRKRVSGLVGSGLWTPSAAEAELPERLGDFRILRRLGQGGMGVVFLAEQQSVARRVALKLVKTDHLFHAGSRQRFLREAQAIARLDHPGIVGVLTVGEEAGIPYFAMEYVRGAPLDRLLESWRGRAPESIRGEDVQAAIAAHLADEEGAPSVEWNAAAFRRGWVEIALSLVRDVALALHHAHQRGVLHRDVKSANVLIEPSGRVRLLDFGLASLESSQSITRTGSVLGSLHYMSPEQVDGRTSEVAVTSDVYSLGVMLYELLALRLPYRGETHEAVRRAILDARPESLRARNPSVSVDVETVCFKAMDRDPARRYASAEAFARDLENVLELRPVHARPPSTRTRIVRWTQRRPATAVATLFGALLLVAGPLGYQLSRARAADQLRESADRAEQDFQSALRSIGEVLRETAVEDLEDVPRMQQARLAQLDRAFAVFADLSRARPADPRLLFEGGELHRARADVLRDLGRVQESLADYELAIDFDRRTLAVDARPEVRTALAAALTHAGKAHSALFELESARPLIAEGVELSRVNVAALPDELETKSRLCAALTAQAELEAIGGDPAVARRAAEEAVALAEELRAAKPDSAWYAWSAGRALSWVAVLDDRAGDQDSRRGNSELALEAFARARELDPARRFFRHDVADAQLALGLAHYEAGEKEAGEELLRDALATLDELLRDFPDSARYHATKSRVLENLGIDYARRGRQEEARTMLESVAEERERAAQAAPARCDLAIYAAMALNNVAANRLERNEELEDALARLGRARELLERCAGRGHASIDAVALDSMVRYSTALALLHLNRADDALPAIERHGETVGEDPLRLRYSADLWNEYVLALDRLGPGNSDRAARREQGVARLFELLGRAIDAGYRERAEIEGTPALAGFRDLPEFRALLEKLDR